MTPPPWEILVIFAAPLLALGTGFFFFHRFRPAWTHWPVLVSCAAVAVSSWSLAWSAMRGAVWDATLWHWLNVGAFSVDFGVRVDGLNASILAMVATVGTLIHAYSVGYMRMDPDFSRFFLTLHFFFLSMVGLLLSNNYMQLYVFWEGVGLASYLLIGFWYDRERARAAAWKAFLTNRVGDAGFLLALFLLLRHAGSVRFQELFASLPSAESGSPAWVTAAAALLFWGACAKSAQFPLHVWLPDAMEGPTPVSALMHAATMVTAGIFLMARSWPLLERAPALLPVIACVGAGTALGAACLASVKKDLKRVLAYSTVSHLGLMMLSIGLGNVYAAVFHLITHGVFKALLFLCVGNVLHAVGASSAGVDETGGMDARLPGTYLSFCVGAAALAGLPPLAGFFSKDAILEGTFHSGSILLVLAACLTAVGSSFYVFRLLLLSFVGRRPEQNPPSHVHAPDAWMAWPVYLLAGLCPVVGALGPSGLLQSMLRTPGGYHFSWATALWGTCLALAGLAAAYGWTVLRPGWDWDWRRRHPEWESRLDQELGWQRTAASIARSGADCSRWTADTFEARGLVPWTEALADGCVGLGEGLSGLSRGLVNEHLWWMLVGAGTLTLACLIPWAI